MPRPDRPGNETRSGGGNGGPRRGDRADGTPTASADGTKATTQTLRERWDGARENLRVTASALPRSFGLVWSAHRGLTFTLGVLAVVSAVIPSATAWVSKLLVDSVLAAARAGTTADSPLTRWVVVLVAAQLGLYLGGSALQTIRSVVQQALQELTGNHIQLKVMQQANRLDLALFEDAAFYDKLQRAQREASSRPLNIVQGLFGLAGAIITFLSMIALMARLSWVVAAIALIAPIPSFIASSKYGRQGFWMAMRQSQDWRRSLYFVDLLTRDTYNKEIKLFGLGTSFMGRWKVIADRLIRENRDLLTKRSVASFAWGSLTTLVTSGTYLYVALQVIARRLTIGDLTFYTQAVGYVQSSFQSILSSISSLYEGSLYLNTLFEFLDYEPRIRNRPDAVVLTRPFRSGIEFHDVWFTYPGKTVAALQGVSFKVGLDETVALVGQNGAGKTTLVKLLTRLYDPDTGEIYLNGLDIRAYDLESLRAAVGVIFQDYVTYFMSVADNIGVGRLEAMEDREQIELSASKSGADAFIDKLPDRYGTMLGKWFDAGFQLSGGEWQKVALARAFMRDAEILILDEPTASLDARAEYEIFARMQRLTEGKMALFISHRFSTVRLADRIIVLEDGKIKEDGTHEALLAISGTYAELFNLQAAAYR